MSGGVRLTEDQFQDIMGRLLEIEDLAARCEFPHPTIDSNVRLIAETLSQEHYPTVPEPDDLDGSPF